MLNNSFSFTQTSLDAGQVCYVFVHVFTILAIESRMRRDFDFLYCFFLRLTAVSVANDLRFPSQILSNPFLSYIDS